MPKPIEDALEQLWREVTVLGAQEALTMMREHPPPQTRFEIRAEETTRVAREVIGAEAEERTAKTARLRQARLKREAEETRAASTSAKNKRR